MRILLATSEVHPYSKTGGLADMTGALAKALAQAGHHVRVVSPLYRCVREKFPALRKVDWIFDLPLGSKRTKGSLWAVGTSDQLTHLFVEQNSYFDRNGIYGDHGHDYADNAERFTFFSKCATNLARYLPQPPEVVHLNDWQTGLAAAMIHHDSRRAGWGNAPGVCFTIHNLAYQGTFSREAFTLTNLPASYFAADGVEFYGKENCLKAGIAFAQVVTTVSPRYAREIMTEEFGCGLDGLLRKRRKQVFGILNGADYEEWNTTRNAFLRHPYSAIDMAGKALNKAALQQELALPMRPDVPLFGTISRLADQKGMDILLGALEEVLQTDVQFVLLGSGSKDLERKFSELARRYPERLAVRLGYDQALSHRIEAGCDYYVMPSKYEPCGLNQIYSLRYGTIPIVRAVGGLDDSVIDVSQDPSRANGIKFSEYSSAVLARAMCKAVALFNSPDSLGAYRWNGMHADYSWQRAEKEYLAAYETAVATAKQ